MPCQRRRFQHFVQNQIGQVERRSWTRHSLKSSQTERLNCCGQTWNKWISSLKHFKSVPFDFSHFDLSAMVLQEVNTCQLMLANRSCHTIFFIPSKKRRKSCQTAFRRFPIVPFQISSIARSCRFLQTTLVNNPSQAVGLCKCFHLGVRMDVVDLSFQWAKLPGNVIPMEVPWIYTNLHLNIFCTYFFGYVFVQPFNRCFFPKNYCCFRHFRLARCCMLFSLGLVWWLAGFLRMPRLSALLKAGGAPKRPEDRARLRVAKTWMERKQSLFVDLCEWILCECKDFQDEFSRHSLNY